MNQIEHARTLHESSIVIDACSFFLRGISPRLQAAGTTAINFTVPMPMDGMAEAIVRIKEYYELAAREPRIVIAYTAKDIVDAKASGKFAAIIGAQNSRLVGTDLGFVEVLWRLGLRVMQLTYNERNFVADGCLEPDDAGVSFFGRRLIGELNQAGIVVDLSHAGVRSSLEAAEISEQPVVMTHVGLRSRVNSQRAVADEQLRAVAATGGVVGVTSHPSFNWLDGDRRPHLNDFLDAIETAVEVVGIDHVGIGTDHVVEPNGYPETMKRYLAETYDVYSPDKAANTARLRLLMNGLDPREDQLEEFGGMQDLPKVTAGLLARGFGDEDVSKVLGGNFFRVFQAVWRQ